MKQHILYALVSAIVSISFIITGCEEEEDFFVVDQIEPLTKEDNAYCLNPEVEAAFMKTKSLTQTPYIKMYEHANYKGGYYFAYSTSGNISDFSGPYPQINDQVSSVEVFNGARVNMYQHSNYGGISMFVFENVPDFKTYGYNDMFSSLRWYTNSVFSRFIILYQHNNYVGRNTVVFERIEYMSRYYLDDAVSSIRFVNSPNSRLRVFEHPAYGGFYKDFTGSNSNLKNTGFDDRISSVKVYR